MRIPAAFLFIGCCAAVPVAAEGQTSILPPTATLNPESDARVMHPDAQHYDPQRSEAQRSETLAARGEAGAPGHGGERVRRGDGRAPRGRSCFNQAEAREAIAAHRLIDPVRALRLGRQQGDALSAKLCRWPSEEFVYELSVLRRDGRILHLFMNAKNGDAVAGQAQGGQVQAAPAGGRATGTDR